MLWCHCMLDGGSQKSIVHESIVKELMLSLLRHNFGSSTHVGVSLENVVNTQQRVEKDRAVCWFHKKGTELLLSIGVNY